MILLCGNELKKKEMKEKEKEKKMAGIIEELNHIANEVQVKIENTKPLAGEEF